MCGIGAGVWERKISVARQSEVEFSRIVLKNILKKTDNNEPTDGNHQSFVVAMIFG